jgi:tripartite-type tricarboxylate transporter receptor subunit TctC
MNEERSMQRRRWFIAAPLALFAIATVAAMPALAQDYPARPIRFITDSAPGSAIDVPMRIIAEGLSRALGQQAVIVNQPGAGGAISVRAVSTATPDGYTFGMLAVSAFVAVPGSADNLPVEVPRDFVPVGNLGAAPMFITAAPWLDVKTLSDLIALAKKKPSEIAYGTNGQGRLTHLTGELLQNRAGIKLLMVPYSGGTPQVLNDMMGGRIALLFDAYSGIAGAIESGRVLPLAVSSAKRLADFPDLPAVAETLPGFEATGWQVLVAPLGTPDAVVRKVNAALAKVLSDPEIQRRLAHLGRDFKPMSPEETLAFIHGEQQKWAPILSQVGQSRQ